MMEDTVLRRLYNDCLVTFAALDDSEFEAVMDRVLSLSPDRLSRLRREVEDSTDEIIERYAPIYA